jgi:hypothetical protein
MLSKIHLLHPAVDTFRQSLLVDIKQTFFTKTPNFHGGWFQIDPEAAYNFTHR